MLCNILRYSLHCTYWGTRVQLSRRNCRLGSSQGCQHQLHCIWAITLYLVPLRFLQREGFIKSMRAPWNPRRLIQCSVHIHTDNILWYIAWGFVFDADAEDSRHSSRAIRCWKHPDLPRLFDVSYVSIKIERTTSTLALERASAATPRKRWRTKRHWGIRAVGTRSSRTVWETVEASGPSKEANYWQFRQQQGLTIKSSRPRPISKR